MREASRPKKYTGYITNGLISAIKQVFGHSLSELDKNIII